MTIPCEQEAKIIRIDTEMIGIKKELSSINGKITWGMGSLVVLMTAILVAVCIGMFKLGGIVNTMDSIQNSVTEFKDDINKDIKALSTDTIILIEKMAAVEDVVYENGIYQTIRELNNGKK